MPLDPKELQDLDVRDPLFAEKRIENVAKVIAFGRRPGWAEAALRGENVRMSEGEVAALARAKELLKAKGCPP